MTSDDYQTLMHQEIDGENSPAESRRLHAYLAGHAEARQEFDELRDAVAMVEEASPLAAPTDLQARILDAAAPPVAAPVPPPRAADRQWSRIGRHDQLRPVLAFAAGFALCLLLSITAWTVLTPQGFRPLDDLRGTIVRQVDQGQGVRSTPVAIAGDGLSGVVSVLHTDLRSLVHLDLSSDRPVTVALLLGGAIACESYCALDGSPGNLTVSDQDILLWHDGDGAYDLVLKHPDQPDPEIVFQVREHETILFERTLTRDDS